MVGGCGPGQPGFRLLRSDGGRLHDGATRIRHCPTDIARDLLCDSSTQTRGDRHQDARQASEARHSFPNFLLALSFDTGETFRNQEQNEQDPGSNLTAAKCGDYREAVGKINNMKVVCTMKTPV